MLIKSVHNIENPLQIQGDINPRDTVDHNHYSLDPM